MIYSKLNRHLPLKITNLEIRIYFCRAMLRGLARRPFADKWRASLNLLLMSTSFSKRKGLCC